jgi:hypothetical protein
MDLEIETRAVKFVRELINLKKATRKTNGGNPRQGLNIVFKTADE